MARSLSAAGIQIERIHGNRSQAQRTQALGGFKSGKYRVLVATDIAARGIDVTALGHVVNFDVPAVPEDYIHRVGRTARAEATGTAFSLVSPEEEGDVRAIERAIEKRLPRVTVPDFDYHQASAPKDYPPRRSGHRPPGHRPSGHAASGQRPSDRSSSQHHPAGHRGPGPSGRGRPRTVRPLASFAIAMYAP